MSAFRSRVAAALVAVLATTFISTVTTPEPAFAAIEPSVPLPTTPSTPVTRETVTGRGQDQASSNALNGDQRPGGTPAKGAGTPKATSLSPSATWEVSAQMGDFTWSYPLRVPPAPGGLEPELALSYSSSAVDGRTSATNNQASWVGDGWELSPGFIERVYGACSEDTMGGTTPPADNGDLCWRSDNAVASFNGGGGQLVCCDGANRWRLKNDDGSRIERLPGAGNGDNDGEHWKITTVDGTQLFFGSRPEAKSTWTVPVFGDDRNEPCNNAAGFGASYCTQAWRWNLDKVVDRNGNLMLYGYDAETNSYGLNGKDAAVSYVRGGTLRTVEYGMRDGQPASGQVEFVVADRCVPGSTCTPDKKENWPDVPWDEKCDTATCSGKASPTFWSTKRLAKVVTRVRNGGGFTDVDSWTLEHLFPKTGDGQSEKATLWLRGIVHTGHVGGEVRLPAVTFEGIALPNRVYKVDGLAPLHRYRVTGVLSEAGGSIAVQYAGANCVEGSSMPANPETNTLRCFPVRWQKDNIAERTDYFHKYVVESVTQSDRFSGLPVPITANIQQVTTYEYLDGAAWHYDRSEFTKAEKKTWDEFRGYGKVRIRTGVPGDPSGPVGMTERRFYRGMHGDKLPTGTRGVQVQGTRGPARDDEDWLNGTPLETTTYDGDTDRVVATEINTPTWQGPTATRDALKSYIVRAGLTESWTALAGGDWRTTRAESTFDERGLVRTVSDLGDTSTAADDRCTSTWYARNEGAWLMNLPSRAETVAVRCGATPVFPDNAISDVLSEYDGVGNLITSKSLSARPSSGAPGYYTTATNTYDLHGRVTESRDALRRLTRTAYTPTNGGPVTRTTVTGPLGHTVSTTLTPAWGLPTAVLDANQRLTETAYDPLGRTARVWLPNRSRTTYQDDASARFSYLIRGDAPTVVTSEVLNAKGNYVTTKEIYDGLLRLRQEQVPAVGGGRLLTDTRYDSQGRAYRTTQPYFNNAALDDNIWVASDAQIPGHTLTTHDGAGRPIAEIYKAGVEERWRTSTAYGGDRVHVTPPRGGTATTVISDARGQTVELRQYRGATPTGAYDSTTYTHTEAGQRKSVKDPSGNVWRYEYDIRGNQIRSEDPDRGVSTMTYDDAGQLLTVKDARDVTLTSSYDPLGRKRTVKAGDTQLAEWTYDTATGGVGQLASATRYVDGAAYTTSFDYYTELYHPYQTKVTIPQSPRTQTLAGTYTTYSTLNWDGTPKGMTLPEIGDLKKETVSQEYDDLGNPTTLTGGPAESPTFEYVTSSEYTRFGETARLELGPIGKRAWLSYYYEDSTRRLTRSIVDAEVPRPMQTDVNYTYDPAGNVTSIANTPKDLPHDAQCFRYDHLRRLTEAWTPTGDCAAAPGVGSLGGAAPYWHSYTYDAVGNRLTETQHASAGDTVRTYGYPAAGAHKVESVTTTAPGAAAKTESFTYDSIGNMSTRPGQQLDWNPLGKLEQVSEGDKKTRFVYDADGERLLREDPTTITLYLGGQDLKLTKSTGKLTATRYYQHGDSTVATRTAAGVSWEAGDHQDTAQVAIDFESQKVSQRRQTPFGAPRGTPVPWAGDKGFVGGTLDSSTGLTNLGARQYDPQLGRFISVDPVLDLSDPQQMHGYTYSNNSPVTFSDPTGLLWGWLKKAAKSVWNGIKTVAKHAAPVVGIAAMAFAATPIGGALAVAALVAGGINTVSSCFGDKKALGCAAHVLELAPGVGKLAVGAARYAGNALNASRLTSGVSSTGSYRTFREMGKLGDEVGHLGSRPSQWLSRETIGERSELIEAGGYFAGTYYYATCGIKTVDCYGSGGSAAGQPGASCVSIVQLCDPGPKTAEPSWLPSLLAWSPPPGAKVYPPTFTGPIPGQGVRAVRAPTWPDYHRTPPQRRASQAPPPKRSVPGPNNTYTTGDGRTCNRGGGMCAM
ncbi:RHS repeat-associated core domain-containing protein [Plantactinospora mayteni]|uniref:Type IV secretion protein Rhs n=1 Tax=Plantactinospora mayteni TaxID=566021 RepID=A0ABQ4EI51_9ACTN|nr:RHS repeat-associated core domain-containing protein [Plantactinospora mayteni]GIG94408.1 type IV secretion protein Rhs [Plantactinospora mayteni]